MKYSPEQKEKLRKSQKQTFRVQFSLKNRIKNQYPVYVEFIGGYFIIESKLNTMKL